MSFRCQKCGQAQPTGTRPAQVVTELRAKEYKPQQHRGRDGKLYMGPTGHGFEIAKTLRVCKECEPTIEVRVQEPPRVANTLGDLEFFRKQQASALPQPDPSC